MNNDNIEYDYIEHRPSPATLEKKRRKRRRIISAVLAWTLVVTLMVVVIGSIVGTVMVYRGKQSLKEGMQNAAPVLEFADTTTEETDVVEESKTPIEWQSDWITHNGQVYDYNEEIMTFLVMGIDTKGEVKTAVGKTSGGQSDAMFLVVANPITKNIDLIGINRDTIVEITCYGHEQNGEVLTTQAQLCTQHGFGDGKEESAGYTIDAVSSLFYNLPIHGYVSINYDAVPIINDAVGGVDLVCLEDMTFKKKGWTEGAQIHIEGKDAIIYLNNRDVNKFESARGRLARQKQYLTTYIGKVVEETKADVTFPLQLYSALSKYMVTDVSADELTYLTTQLIGYSFGEIHTLTGETKVNGRFEEFYPDYDAMKELMLDVFYNPIDMDLVSGE